MPKKRGRSSITVNSKVWNAVFDRKVVLEIVKRQDVGMGKAIEDLLTIRSISELVYWFELNCDTMGFGTILPYSIALHPTFCVKRDGKEINIALELRSSELPEFFRETDSIDQVVCLENDEKLEIPTITINKVKYQKQIPLTIFITKQDHTRMRAFKRFNWVKFLREKVREKVNELEKKGEKKQ